MSHHQQTPIIIRWLRLDIDALRQGSGRPEEFAILAVAAGIARWCEVHSPDPFGAGEIVWPLISTFRSALNFDCGRLSCGDLDAWAADLARAWCINPDTGDFVGVLDGDHWTPRKD